MIFLRMIGVWLLQNIPRNFRRGLSCGELTGRQYGHRNHNQTYHKKDMFDENDLRDYFGDGKPATVKEATEDMLKDFSIFDFFEFYDPLRIVEIKQVR